LSRPAGAVAAIVASDAQVRRELEARSIYLQTAYRDPKAATTRSTMSALDGATGTSTRSARGSPLSTAF
jgi:hypothetical protein